MTEEVFDFDGCVFNYQRGNKIWSVYVGGPNNLALMQTLWAQFGRCVPYDKIINAIWGIAGEPGDVKNNIKQMVHHLNKKLGVVALRIVPHPAIGLSLVEWNRS